VFAVNLEHCATLN